MAMVEAGRALCVPGNHDVKLLRKLNGATCRSPTAWPSRSRSSSGEPPEFRRSVARVPRRPGQPLRARRRQARRRPRRAEGGDAGPRLRPVRDFALYGETTGETDEFGLPVRYNWAADYRGQAMVVYGHTPVPERRVAQQHDRHRHRLRLRRQADGAALPGARAGLRPGARRPTTSRSGRSCGRATDARRSTAQQAARRPARHRGRARQAHRSRRACSAASRSARRTPIAALEVMSRFAVDPKWLIYLPPTMSPSETTPAAGTCSSTRPRRSPTSATRACRRSSARRSTWARAPSSSCAATRTPRGGGSASPSDGTGIVYTRTGRRFFDDAACEAAVPRPGPRGAGRRRALGRARRPTGSASTASCMPWSAKAQELLRQQYAAVGRRGAHVALGERRRARSTAARARGVDTSTLAERIAAPRQRLAEQATSTPIGATAGRSSSIADLQARAVPSAGDRGAVHTDKDHVWHMETLADSSRPGREPAPRDAPTGSSTSPMRTSSGDGDRLVGGADGARRRGHGRQAARLRRARADAGSVQPAVKCRGPRVPAHHLRPGVHPARAPRTPARARPRPASASLALREFALGIEAWSGSSGASRCGASTSASSACSRWRASRSTRGCKGPSPPRESGDPLVAT